MGYGLYSKNDIEKDEILGEYKGVIGKYYNNMIYAWRYPSNVKD